MEAEPEKTASENIVAGRETRPPDTQAEWYAACSIRPPSKQPIARRCREDRSRTSHAREKGSRGAGMDLTSSNSTGIGSSHLCATARFRLHASRTELDASFSDHRCRPRKAANRDFVLDGEIVVLRPDGRSDFQALQNVLRRGHKNGPVLSVFDLLYLRG